MSQDRSRVQLQRLVSVTVTPDMAHELLVQLQQLKTECDVSPYKADSQLAFLSVVRPSAAAAPVLLWACH